MLQCSNGLLLAAKFGYLDDEVDDNLGCWHAGTNEMYTKSRIEGLSARQIMDLAKGNLLHNIVVENVSANTLLSKLKYLSKFHYRAHT